MKDLKKIECKFVKSDGAKCKSTIAIYDDGYCLSHSQTKEAKESRAKSKKSQSEKEAIGKKLKIPTQSPLVQIRRNCIECCGDNHRAVQFCFSTDCKMWFLRFGKLPKAVVREKGEDWMRLFDVTNFDIGKRYDPDIRIDKMKL